MSTSEGDEEEEDDGVAVGDGCCDEYGIDDDGRDKLANRFDDADRALVDGVAAIAVPLLAVAAVAVVDDVGTNDGGNLSGTICCGR